MRNTIYGTSADFIKQFKITYPGTATAWLNYLRGTQRKTGARNWVFSNSQRRNVVVSFCPSGVGLTAVL